MNMMLKLVFVTTFTALLGFLLSPVHTTVSYNEVFDVGRTRFFNYLSDPNNFKTINPTILDLEVKYCDKERVEVYYTEHLVQLPFVTNFAEGVYTLLNDGPVWKMQSSHSTCFLTRLFCLPTMSTVYVEPINENYNIQYTEDITYSCPRMFNQFCSKEVALQRKLIMDSLKNVFPNKID